MRFENNEMTQLELANLAKCTRQTIIALEAGKYIPSLILAHRIAKVFGVGIEQLFQINDDA
jgi:putative transcriptional regulator